MFEREVLIGEVGGRLMSCNEKKEDDRCGSGPCLAQVMNVQGISKPIDGLQELWQWLSYRHGDGRAHGGLGLGSEVWLEDSTSEDNGEQLTTSTAQRCIADGPFRLLKDIAGNLLPGALVGSQRA